MKWKIKAMFEATNQIIVHFLIPCDKNDLQKITITIPSPSQLQTIEDIPSGNLT
jgi:hypothetical protein